MTGFLLTSLTLLLQSTCLLLLGLLALRLTRRHGPTIQTLIGRATLSGVALLLLLAPLSGHVRPLWRIPTPAQAPTLPKREGEPVIGHGVALASREKSDRDTPLPALPPVPDELPINQETPRRQTGPPSRFGRVGACAGVGLWLVLSSLFLLWLIFCQVHLTRLRRTASLITSGPALTLLSELTSHPPTLLTHPSVHSPFLAGLRRPAIFLPVAYETEFDTPALRAILVHELAHRDRRDNAWTLLARLLTAVLWHQPLLWLLCRRLEQISEDACDEAVLASDCPPRAYADCLLTLAERRQSNQRQRTLTAGVAPFRSSLGRRVQYILSEGTYSMTTISTRLRLTIAVLTIAAALGGVLLVSSSPAQVNQPVSSLTDQLSLSQAQFLAGLTAVEGPGVVVTLTDSRKPFPSGMPAGMAPPNIIHDTDINQVVNELKAAGAEAIAVNDQRLVATSAVRCVGLNVYVNNAPLLAPYIIKAIGEPKSLETALSITGGIASQIKQYDKAMFSDREAAPLMLPAYPIFSQSPLSQAQFLAGLTSVQGHGVVVTLTDSKVPFPSGLPHGMAAPNIIHDSDINQVVNELKAAGAEAIAVNDQRLVATSAVRNAGPTILINGIPQAPPYIIKAIGKPKALLGALNISGGIASQVKQFDKAMFSSIEVTVLTVPAYTGKEEMHYAKPVNARRQAQIPNIASLPKHTYLINWQTPQKGIHAFRVFATDAEGKHLVFAETRPAASKVDFLAATVGMPASLQIYDNGKLTKTLQFGDRNPKDVRRDMEQGEAHIRAMEQGEAHIRAMEQSEAHIRAMHIHRLSNGH